MNQTGLLKRNKLDPVCLYQRRLYLKVLLSFFSFGVSVPFFTCQNHCSAQICPPIKNQTAINCVFFLLYNATKKKVKMKNINFLRGKKSKELNGFSFCISSRMHLLDCLIFSFHIYLHHKSWHDRCTSTEVGAGPRGQLYTFLVRNQSTIIHMICSQESLCSNLTQMTLIFYLSSTS